MKVSQRRVVASAAVVIQVLALVLPNRHGYHHRHGSKIRLTSGIVQGFSVTTMTLPKRRDSWRPLVSKASDADDNRESDEVAAPALESVKADHSSKQELAPIPTLLTDHNDAISSSSSPQELPLIWHTIRSNPSRSVAFSLLMTVSGAVLGPFLDSFHSAFGVLQYDNPSITAQLWSKSMSGSVSSAPPPALITTWWVPPLFGLAGFLIGWLYILLDVVTSMAVPRLTDSLVFDSTNNRDRGKVVVATDTSLQPPKVLVGIAVFTFQYWLSGLLYALEFDRTTILYIMSLTAAVGFATLDGSWTGFIVSTATAVGGPLIECLLLTLSQDDTSILYGSGYHYTDLGETGFFPLWIVPVYFLGGPANGNLARAYWTALTPHHHGATDVDPSTLGATNTADDASKRDTGDGDVFVNCQFCADTRRVPCPNCDGIGTYVATGGRTVPCTSCRSKGFVICRDCFARYADDPNDIQAIRDLLSRMPD